MLVSSCGGGKKNVDPFETLTKQIDSLTVGHDTLQGEAPVVELNGKVVGAANVGQAFTDSIYFCQTYDAYRIFKAARRSVAWKARKEAQRGAVCQAAC